MQYFIHFCLIYILFLTKYCHCTGIPGLWTQELDAGLWTLDTGLCTLDTGCWTLDVRCCTLDAWLWALDTIVDCFRTKSEASSDST